MKKIIEVKCKGAEVKRLEEIQEFQGELKELSKENYEKLKRSIIKNGFCAPFFIWKPLNTISKKDEFKLIDGHQRLRVLLELKSEGYEIPPLPVVYIYAKDEKEAREKLLAITSQYGEITKQGLYEFITKANISADELLEDYRLPEIDLEQFKVEFFDEKEKLEAGCDEDEVPEVKETTAKLGDLFELGENRLICADSTDILQVERLMNGQKADMVFTDPPYGMNLNTNFSYMNTTNDTLGKKESKNYRPIEGDDRDFDPNFLLGFYNYCSDIFLWGADYYAERLVDKNKGSWIVWDKRCNETFDKMIGSSFELCWSKYKHKRDIARIRFAGVYGTETQDIKKRIHPSQKPIQLTEWFFENWGKDKINIVDLYGGSGSTLIACEKTQRKCFMSELDPHYVDVIIQRWQKFSNKKAYLINSDGSKTLYDELKKVD